MTPALVLSDDTGPVRILTMNRPEARNALSPNLIGTLYAALREADDDASVRAVVLTGADPAFCAGVDLKEAQRLGSVYFEQFQKQSCIRQTGEMRTPIIAAINGAVFTGGLEMALGCDFLIASERAVFADTHARVGILPGGGMTARLPQLVGAAMARRLSMTGEVVDAARAERIADAAYSYFVTGNRLSGQPPYFNSIFFKNLLLLESVTGGDTYRQAMADYADQVWTTVRDPQTGLVRFDTGGTTQSIQQAAMAQIYAVLAWPRAKWSTLY